MRYPIIILSGDGFEYHTCETMQDFFEAAYAECKKFINCAITYDSGTATKFSNNEESAKYLLADCLLKEDFGDICTFIKMVEDMPCEGTFPTNMFD